MGADAADERLAHAAELERRDAAVARELETVRDLAERAGAVRARAGELRADLDRIPLELDELAGRRRDAEADAASARSELEAAESHLAEVEGASRRRPEEVDRARRVAATAREQVVDLERQLERLGTLEEQLLSAEQALRAEAAMLPEAAGRLAADIRAVARVTESAGEAPGPTLDEVDDWGARVRSALFVARGTLESERERIVVEANALGTAVLGEDLGGSSVPVVRRRLEERHRP